MNDFFLNYLILIIFGVSVNFCSVAQSGEFLNIAEHKEFSILIGEGYEAGFYFEVEVDVPGQFNLLDFESKDQNKIYELALKHSPNLVFSENTANCRLLQEPYFKATFKDFYSFLATYGYLVKADSSLKNKFCHLEVLNFKKDAIKDIEYFTYKGTN